jgi:cysteinyl-tRNA synthetase
MSGASAGDILALCDKLRDVDLIPLGVALDDQDGPYRLTSLLDKITHCSFLLSASDGKALVKLVSPDTLTKARDEKLALLAEKSAKKSTQADAAKAKQLAKLERGKVPPTELFRPPNVPEGTYGSWDERGVPLTDGEGAEITKSRSKKLVKEWEIQGKMHEEWKAWMKANA